MIKDLKDSGKINIVLTLLFVIGVAVSAYVLFRLPTNLMIPYGYESVFNPLFVIVGITFLVGMIALVQALRYKKEIIVYRDRVTESNQGDQDAASSMSSINVDNIKSALRSAKNQEDILQLGLQSICKQLDAGQGAVYQVRQENDTRFVELTAGYALTMNENTTVRYNFGEGLIGQAATNAQLLYLDEVPDGYIKIISGLGSSSPRYLIIAPVKKEETVLGILEIASFSPYNADQRKFVEQGAQLIAETLSTK
jgi:transcriptional regulator with GAF, ATPase, and Fis domain